MQRQLPESMYDHLLDQRQRGQMGSLYKLLDDRLRLLENPTTVSRVYNASPNLIPNSRPEWSTMAYTTASTTPATAGDTNHECYNWERHTAATTDISTNGAALLGSGHSSYAGLGADVPVWDRTNGTFKLGSSTTNYDISCLLPTDFVHPGQRFYVYFEASKGASDTDIDDAEFYCGFWDDTAGQEKWIEGSTFTPTVGVYGSEGARTLEYKILAETDTGDQMLSTAVSVTTAPSTLTRENHVRLNFSGAPGFIRFVIYRKDGSDHYRVGEIRNSIDLQFFDISETGDTVVPVDGYPSVTATAPRAYAVTNGFEPGEVGEFAIHTMTIQVPIAYDRSSTGNRQQYFRFGLTGLVASGSEREVVIRCISVSEGLGGWSRSALDSSAASGPSTSATSSPAPPGGGGTTPAPPTGGSGGPLCLTLDTEIETVEGVKLLRDVRRGDVCRYERESPVIATRTGTVQSVLEIELADGKKVRCTPEHKWITNGKPKSARFLRVGQELTTRDGPSRIVRIEEIIGAVEVKMLTLPYPHLYLANGIVSHNLKRIEDLN